MVLCSYGEDIFTSVLWLLIFKISILIVCTCMPFVCWCLWRLKEGDMVAGNLTSLFPEQNSGPLEEQQGLLTLQLQNFVSMTSYMYTK